MTEALNREQRASPMVLTEIIFFNLIPLIGVIFWRWSLFPVIFLYWVENIIVGVFNWLRIILARGADKTDSGQGKGPQRGMGPDNIFLAVFFPFHYGIFTAVHGVFVFALFGNAVLNSGIGGEGGSGFFGKGDAWDQNVADLYRWPMILAIGGLALSHAFTFLRDAMSGAFHKISPGEQMVMPYGRIVVLHLLVLFGGWIVMALGGGTLLIIALVLLKIGIEMVVNVSGIIAKPLSGNMDP